jgi:hypothetical protein
MIILHIHKDGVERVWGGEKRTVWGEVCWPPYVDGEEGGADKQRERWSGCDEFVFKHEAAIDLIHFSRHSIKYRKIRKNEFWKWKNQTIQEINWEFNTKSISFPLSHKHAQISFHGSRRRIWNALSHLSNEPYTILFRHKSHLYSFTPKNSNRNVKKSQTYISSIWRLKLCFNLGIVTFKVQFMCWSTHISG